uniref:Uncharacterized protein n=1 Tax=Meloidogyne enterolobii TaxID=390850 RepID=A0A6V7VG72_MELEN|nr:unnamed protein product [Meloidogyne enterolobii]
MLGINTINSDVDAVVILEENEKENEKINIPKFNQYHAEEVKKYKNMLERPTSSNCEGLKLEDGSFGINPLLASLICSKDEKINKEINEDNKNIEIDIKEKRLNQVFGTENVNCQFGKREECNDQSLFCFLCRDRRVTDIKRITEAWIKLIEFKIFGVDIDIAFVGLPEWPLKENSDEWLNAVLASNKNNALTKLQPISGYSSNKYLINLLNNEGNNKMPITFCNALIALKIWAKSKRFFLSFL